MDHIKLELEERNNILHNSIILKGKILHYNIVSLTETN